MVKQLFKVPVAVVVLATILGGLSSCDTPVGQGAGIGAASGAIIGGLATNRVEGAALGAAAGAAAGSLVGAAVQDSNAEAYGPRPERGYPVAGRTEERGFVVSPYPPHHLIDTRGVPHGALVRDPSCDRLFVQP